jgi:hypothetical protein
MPSRRAIDGHCPAIAGQPSSKVTIDIFPNSDRMDPTFSIFGG